MRVIAADVLAIRIQSKVDKANVCNVERTVVTSYRRASSASSWLLYVVLRTGPYLETKRFSTTGREQLLSAPQEHNQNASIAFIPFFSL